MDVTFQQLQKYESGKNRLPAAKLFTLARFLGLPLESFFAGLDDDKQQWAIDPASVRLLHSVYAADDGTLHIRLSGQITLPLAPLSSGETAGR